MRPATGTERAISADALASFGDRPALIAGDGAVSYRDLAERVRARARELGPQRRLVMIHGGNASDAIVSYLAALEGGHVAWLVPDGGEGAPPPAAWLPPDVVVPRAGGLVELDRGSMHELHPALALLLGTSGSTGAPRLVRISHDGLLSNARAIASYLGITASDRAVTSLPMHYCYGLSVVNSHLVSGAALLLTERSVTDDGFWDLVREQGATSFAGVPHTFDLLDRVGFAQMELPSLRYVTQAGGRLAPERVRRYASLAARGGWRFVVMYGQTEATARMAYLPPDMAGRHPGAVGVPIPGGSFEIRDVPEAREPGVGELVYRGPNVMLGYAECPGDLALGRVVHELPTGDLARIGPAGLVEIVGRRSRFLKLFGLRIDLDEVERILARQGVAAACAGSDERMVVAVPGGVAPGVVPALARHLGLPPSCIELLTPPEMPRLPNGKTDYRALAAMAAEQAGAVPRGGDVAAAFCDVLGRASVSEHDTFASLGGDSLSYVEMSLALEEVLGHLPEDWPHRTVAELGACARRRGRGARLETNVVLRAAAVVLVVASHMTAFWPAGGAHLLLALAGHSFARFQLGAADVPGRLGRAASSIARIAVPASIWIGVVMLVAGGYGLGTLLLVNNYAGDASFSGGRWHYWFIETLVQLLIVLALFLSIPAVRRLERRDGFAFAVGLLGLALAFRFDLLGIGPEPNHIFRTHTVAWVFLLGWAIQRAATPGRRLAVSALVLACVPGFFGEPVREAVVMGGLLLLIWVPVVVVPGRLSKPIGLVAAASLYIYLTHWQVWPALADVLPIGVVLPLTIGAGIAAWIVVERMSAFATRASRARPHLLPRRPAPLVGRRAPRPAAPATERV